jgi:hypothetical protein
VTGGDDPLPAAVGGEDPVGDGVARRADAAMASSIKSRLL